MSEPTGSRAATSRAVRRSSAAGEAPRLLSKDERAQLAYLERIAATEAAELFRRILAGERIRTVTGDGAANGSVEASSAER